MVLHENEIHDLQKYLSLDIVAINYSRLSINLEDHLYVTYSYTTIWSEYNKLLK